MEDLQKCSSWELLQILTHRGWNLQRGPKEKNKKKSLPPVTATSRPKVFYMYTLQIQSKDNVAYLKALCASDILFDQGCLTEIHHGQTAKYYLSICDGTSDGRLAEEFSAALQLQDEADQPAQLQLKLDVEPQLFFSPQKQKPIADADPMDTVLLSGPRKASQPEDFSLSDLDSIDSVSFVSEGGPDSESGFASETGQHAAAPSLGYSPSIAPSAAPLSPPKAISSDSENEVEPCVSKPLKSNEGAALQPEVDAPMADAEDVAPPRLVLPPPADGSASDVLAGKKSSHKHTGAETHPDSFDWGPFRFTFTGPHKRPPHGQWQANCPYHRLSERTGCTRAMQAGPTEQTKEEAKRTLQTWCLLAPHHDRKRHHTSACVKSSDVLPQGLLDIRLSALKLPAGKPPTDEELDLDLDAAETQDEKKKAQPRAKAKAKGKAKAKTKAACNRRASKESASKKRKAVVLSDDVLPAAATASCRGKASSSGSNKADVSSQSSHRSSRSSSSSSSSSTNGSSSGSASRHSSAVASDSD